MHFGGRFLKPYPNIKFHKNTSSRTPVVPCGRTDMMKLIVDFPSVANMPGNEAHNDCLTHPHLNSLDRNCRKSNCPGIKPKEISLKARQMFSFPRLFVVYISSRIMLYMQWHSHVIGGWPEQLNLPPSNGSYELKELYNSLLNFLLFGLTI